MWKLMYDDAIGSHDKKLMCDFINSGAKLSYGQKVNEFEALWSKWLGVKHSVYVNSGSSANLLLVQAMHDLYGRGDWVAQSCTWATNVSPIMQLKNETQRLHLTDADSKTLGLKLEDLKKLLTDKSNKIKYLFLTHVLGIPCIDAELISLCKEHGITILEDCCESHGSTVNGKKVGTFGKASTFSFFYGHHITTIEGGMISTDDSSLYEHLLLLRSHGLLRELSKESQKARKVPHIDERFTFLCCGYNFRNTDLHAVLGLSQMKRLDPSVEIRNRNFKSFLQDLNRDLYHTDLLTDGVSLFAFPIICKDRSTKDKVGDLLKNMNIEHRPLIAGNLLQHPMLSGHKNSLECPMSDTIHFNSFYVGNNETITQEQITKLVTALNSL